MAIGGLKTNKYKISTALISDLTLTWGKFVEKEKKTKEATQGKG